MGMELQGKYISECGGLTGLSTNRFIYHKAQQDDVQVLQQVSRPLGNGSVPWKFNLALPSLFSSRFEGVNKIDLGN